MKIPRRNCVYVLLSHAVGHDLIFRHYTNKVVVGNYVHTSSDPNTSMAKLKARKNERR